MTTIFVEKRAGEFRVKLKSDDAGTFRLCVETLKDFVSVPLRSYDPPSKQWTVAVSTANRFHTWLNYARERLHAEVQWLDPEGYQPEEARTWTPPPPPHQQPKLTDAYAALYLLPQAPPEVVKAAYRALAQKYHPDRGGDTEAMQRINDAYRRLAA